MVVHQGHKILWALFGGVAMAKGEMVMGKSSTSPMAFMGAAKVCWGWVWTSGLVSMR